MMKSLARELISGLTLLRCRAFCLAAVVGLALILSLAGESCALESFNDSRCASATPGNCGVLHVAWPEASPIAPGPSTEFDVAFEPLGIRTLLPAPRGYHAVLILVDLTSGRQMAFEANYSGTLGNFGYMRARTRDLEMKPLVPDSIRVLVTYAFVPAANYIKWLKAMINELNNSNVPYSPTPELRWNSANSNTFVFSALTHMGFTPPPPPNPATGVTPGYYNALEWESN
jgi:hypothetical protein